MVLPQVTPYSVLPDNVPYCNSCFPKHWAMLETLCEKCSTGNWMLGTHVCVYQDICRLHNALRCKDWEYLETCLFTFFACTFFPILSYFPILSFPYTVCLIVLALSKVYSNRRGEKISYTFAHYADYALFWIFWVELLLHRQAVGGGAVNWQSAV